MSKETNPPPESQLSLSLLENGLDFILKGLDELFGENHTLKNAKATEVETRNFKYGITNLFSGFLLLLKERLSRHIPELIFMGRLSEIKQKLQSGKRIPVTVDLDEALERLEIGPKVTFTQDEIEVIRKIQDFRNQFEHYKITANKYQLWAEISKFLDIIEKFLRHELGIELEKYSKESKLLHKKAGIIRQTVVKYESAIEKEVFDVLNSLAGKEVSARLLGADGSVILPEIAYTQKPYEIGNRKYIPDFEGKSKDGINWILEIKGAYIHTGGIPVLERLLIIQKLSPQTKTWLIAIGDLSDSVKEFAIQNQIYFTDINTWQELKSLSG
jgi:hypothetical protein